MGSDHCPVIADMMDVHPITGVPISQVLGPIRNIDGRLPDPPPFSTARWDEFSGKQAKLSSFFSVQPKVSSASVSENISSSCILSSGSSVSEQSTGPSQTSSGSDVPALLKRKSSSPDSNISTNIGNNSTNKKLKTMKSSGQTSIAAFFSTKPGGDNQTIPATTTSLSSMSTSHSLSEIDTIISPTIPVPSLDGGETTPPLVSNDQRDFALEDVDSFSDFASLATADSFTTETDDFKMNTSTTVNAWSTLFTKPQIPRCYHNEPCLEYRVNKPGPNHGRYTRGCLCGGWQNLFQCCVDVSTYDRHRKSEIRGHYECGQFVLICISLS